MDDLGETREARFERISGIWLARAKGMIVEMKLKPEQLRGDGVVVRMPYNPDFCLDSGGTMLHGGVLTALLDSAFGLANFITVPNVLTMATLDLRVDYLRPAVSKADVLVHAECYRHTRHIAFSSGRVWFEGSAEEEVARGAATFALTRGEGASMLDPLPGPPREGDSQAPPANAAPPTGRPPQGESR